MLFNPFMFGTGSKKMLETKKETMGKKGGAITGGILGYQRIAQEYHEPYEIFQPTIVSSVAEPLSHYAPQLQFAPVTTYGYQGATTIIGSPEAKVSKKQVLDVRSLPEMTGQWDFPVTQTAKPSYETGRETTGLNVTHIAIIAVLGAAGIMLIKKSPKRRRK